MTKRKVWLNPLTIAGVMLMIASLIFVTAEIVFTNGLNKQNITFAGNENYTLYVDVPLYVYVNNISLNLSPIIRLDSAVILYTERMSAGRDTANFTFNRIRIQDEGGAYPEAVFFDKIGLFNYTIKGECLPGIATACSNETPEYNFLDNSATGSITDRWSAVGLSTYNTSWKVTANASLRTVSEIGALAITSKLENGVPNSTGLIAWMNVTSDITSTSRWIDLLNGTGTTTYPCSIGIRNTINTLRVGYDDSHATTPSLFPFPVEKNKPFQVMVQLTEMGCEYYARNNTADDWLFLENRYITLFNWTGTKGRSYYSTEWTKTSDHAIRTQSEGLDTTSNVFQNSTTLTVWWNVTSNPTVTSRWFGISDYLGNDCVSGIRSKPGRELQIGATSPPFGTNFTIEQNKPFQTMIHLNENECLFYARNLTTDLWTYLGNVSSGVNTSFSQLYFSNEGAIDPSEVVYWSDITTYNMSYLDNTYIKVGELDGNKDWYSENQLLTENIAIINTSSINNILDSECNCTPCSIEGLDCRIPFTFHSDTPGLLGIEILRLDYLNNSKINISVRYEENGSLLVGPTITILRTLGSIEQTNTTTTGLLFLGDLAPGDWTFTFSADTFSRRSYTTILDSVNIVNLDAYLSQNTSEVTFTVVDADTSEQLQGVLTTMYRVINNTWVAVEGHYTDITGKSKFSYQEDTRYRFFFARGDYEDYIFYLDPVLFTEYDVKMTRSIAINESQDYDRIALIYTPTLFYDGQENNFTFLIQSPDGELTAYGYTLTYPGGSISESGSIALGSQLDSNFTIMGAETGDTLQLYYYYDTPLSGLRNFTKYYSIVVDYDSKTMIGIRDNTYGLGIFERIFIMVLGCIFIVGIATLIGRPIPGLALGVMFMGMMVYVGFVPLWSVLISMTVALILLGSQMEV